ncbi:MAG TPA: diguanylate cyclase [bacterium]|nr:diguanylate cyclase [bacterium]
MNDSINWAREFPAAITICDRDGVIVEMNDKAKNTFSGDHVGKNVLDCHPEPARTKLAELLATGRNNVYTIEKNGKKKLIFQSPWYKDGRFAGLAEISLELPATIPHFVRG